MPRQLRTRRRRLRWLKPRQPRTRRRRLRWLKPRQLPDAKLKAANDGLVAALQDLDLEPASDTMSVEDQIAANTATLKDALTLFEDELAEKVAAENTAAGTKMAKAGPRRHRGKHSCDSRGVHEQQSGYLEGIVDWCANCNAGRLHDVRIVSGRDHRLAGSNAGERRRYDRRLHQYRKFGGRRKISEHL